MLEKAQRYTVHIPHLTEQQAEALVSQYPNAWKEEQRSEET